MVTTLGMSLDHHTATCQYIALNNTVSSLHITLYYLWIYVRYHKYDISSPKHCVDVYTVLKKTAILKDIAISIPTSEITHVQRYFTFL